MTDKEELCLPRQTLGEEIANSTLHGIGAALSIAGLVLLVVFASLRGDAWRIVSFSVYGASLFLLYISSTLYHGFTNKRVKYFFQTLDHSAIYLLIAGTYTPIALIPLRGVWGWTMFGLIWAMAIAGIIFRYHPSQKYKQTPALFYLGMGWVSLVAIKPMLEMVPLGLLVWIAIGGVCYTLGVVFYIWKTLPYGHSVWHMFVLAGSAAHFLGIFFYLT